MYPKYFTEIQVNKSNSEIGYNKKCMFTGSCFTENIGNKLTSLKYPVDINPFGILYNPVSVANGIRFLIQRKIFTNDDLFFYNNLWHSFFHHSRFSSIEIAKILDTINKRIIYSSDFLCNTDFLFITFGTAWVYEFKKSKQIVSNCHKIPEKEFRRFRLTTEEIVDNYKLLLSELWKMNPKIKIIFTVSPIRHWKDGAIENQRSKSTLILAIDQLIKFYNHNKCDYFPAYEIVMDELRDYRFYAEDMIHLSTTAVNHIWKIFQNTYINKKDRDLSKEILKIIKAINHKPFNKFTEDHLIFLKRTLQNAQTLDQQFPYLNLKSEKDYLKRQINEIEKNNKNL